MGHNWRYQESVHLWRSDQSILLHVLWTDVGSASRRRSATQTSPFDRAVRFLHALPSNPQCRYPVDKCDVAPAPADGIIQLHSTLQADIVMLDPRALFRTIQLQADIVMLNAPCPVSRGHTFPVRELRTLWSRTEAQTASGVSRAERKTVNQTRKGSAGRPFEPEKGSM